MQWISRRLLLACLLLIPSLTVAVAQSTDSALTASSASSTASPDRVAKLEQQVTEAKSSADNAWMLVSAALVLMMTGPGLALFYGGLVRRKNVLSTMMQSFAMMAIITMLWAIIGYSLAFSHGNSFIGGLISVIDISTPTVQVTPMMMVSTDPARCVIPERFTCRIPKNCRMKFIPSD